MGVREMDVERVATAFGDSKTSDRPQDSARFPELDPRYVVHEVSNAATVAVMSIQTLGELLHATRETVLAMNRHGGQSRVAIHPSWGSELLAKLDDMSETCADGMASVEHIAQLVGDLQQVTLRGASAEEVSLAGVIVDALRIVAPQLRERAAVVTEIDDVVVWGRRSRLMQLMVNLLLNAADACAPPIGDSGAKAHTISVRVTRHADQVRVSVDDTGCGMSEELQKKVFRPFVTTKQEGTGLGLALCREIAREHAGRLSCRSEPGRGSTFELELPLHNNRIGS